MAKFRKVGVRKKWSTNLIHRVNFEFANPVEIRKWCKFEDRELSFSKMITRGLRRGFAYPVFFRIGCEVKDRELEFFKNHQEDFAEGVKFSHAL